MGLRRWLGLRSGGSEGSYIPTPEEQREVEERRAAVEQRVLAEMQRQCDRVHAEFQELVSRLPVDKRPETPAEPPCGSPVSPEGRAFTDRMRVLLKRS